MSERTEKSGLDEVLEHRGLKAITDKKKIKNGMTLQMGQHYYIKIGKYAVPFNLKEHIRFDEIKETDIKYIWKPNGNLMYEEKKEE